jgi:hypothetical protein
MPRIAPLGRDAINRKENSMEPNEKRGAEPEEIDIVELGSASELIQENARTRAPEHAAAPGYYWMPLHIFEDDKE